MLTEIMHRLWRKVHRFGDSRRTEVCPPAMLQVAGHSAAGWRAGLRDWFTTGWNVMPDTARHAIHGTPDARLKRVSDEFLQALLDIRTQQAGMLQERIRIARSLRELWHLRPEVFKLVALRYSQAEAQCRLDRLNRHFPTRSPRSGFAALDGPPAHGIGPAGRR